MEDGIPIRNNVKQTSQCKSQGFDQETVSIDIGIWVLHLALLQEHWRNGLITWVLIFDNSASGYGKKSTRCSSKSTSHNGFIAVFDCQSNEAMELLVAGGYMKRIL